MCVCSEIRFYSPAAWTNLQSKVCTTLRILDPKG